MSRAKKKRAEKAKRKSPLRHLRWGAFLPVALTASIGALLLFLPEGRSFSVAMGVLLALSGACFLANAFLSGRAEFLQLLFGVAQIAYAVWLFARSESAVGALIYVFGAVLLLRGLCGLWDVLSSKRRQGNLRKIQLIASLFLAVFAVILFFNPFSSAEVMTVVVGVVMLFTAAFELLSALARLFSGRSGRDETEEKSEKKEKKKKGERKRAKREAPTEEADDSKGKGLFGRKKAGESVKRETLAEEEDDSEKRGLFGRKRAGESAKREAPAEEADDSEGKGLFGRKKAGESAKRETLTEEADDSKGRGLFDRKRAEKSAKTESSDHTDTDGK